MLRDEALDGLMLATILLVSNDSFASKGVCAHTAEFIFIFILQMLSINNNKCRHIHNTISSLSLFLGLCLSSRWQLRTKNKIENSILFTNKSFA